MGFQFRDLPIKKKLNLLTMSISFLVLAISTISLTYLATQNMREIHFDDLKNIADITALNTRAALMFDDRVTAAENLASLRFKPFIATAILSDETNTEVARYQRTDVPALNLDELSKPEVLDKYGLHKIRREIVVDGKLVGVLRITSDFREIESTNRAIIVAASLILIACLIVAYFLSYSFQKVITNPLSTIISMADHIAEQKDYSSRVMSARKDEFGTLINRFNNMVAEIEIRDSNLERIVSERTETLRRTLKQVREANLQLEKQTRDLESERDKAQEATKVKSAFLANMSHEIRTPLNGILGMTNLLLETKLGKEQKELLEMASSSGQSLVAIVNDVLDFSKIEAGKLKISEEDFDLHHTLYSMEQLLSIPAEKKNLVIVTDVSSKVPRMVSGDSLRLRQILTNLVGNSVKFTPAHGGIFILVEAMTVAANQADIHFIVGDSGIGMSEEQLQIIFQAFTQGDTSTTRKYGGTGLGLTISSQLVRLMGGELKVQSLPNRGSVFHFTLKFNIPTEQEIQPQQVELQEEADATHKSLSILLAEDNKVNQLLALKLLNRAGHKVVVAENGAEAVQLYKEQSFDLILMDIQMPIMSGEEATLLIRKDENGSSIPIIALTAHAMAGDRERYLALGMDDYVSKPINKSMLLDAISRVSFRQ